MKELWKEIGGSKFWFGIIKQNGKIYCRMFELSGLTSFSKWNLSNKEWTRISKKIYRKCFLECGRKLCKKVR